MVVVAAAVTGCLGVAFEKSTFEATKTLLETLSASRITASEAVGCPPLNDTAAAYQCDAQGYLNSISFYKRNCSGGYIPTAIGLFDRLTTLDLRFSGIGGTIPSEVGRCTALTSILTAGNKLYGTVPAVLTTLNLSLCTLMLRANETNCFVCPVPSLPCTATLSCNASCPTAPAVSSKVFTLPVSSPTTTTTTKTTTTTPETTTTTTTAALTETTTTTESATATTSDDTTTTTTWQRKTFTHQYGPSSSSSESTSGGGTSEGESTATTRLALIVDNTDASPSNDVSLVIGLACALVVVVPLLLVLGVMYALARAKARKTSTTRGAEFGGAPDDGAEISQPVTEPGSDFEQDAEAREYASVNIKAPGPIYDHVTVALPQPPPPAATSQYRKFGAKLPPIYDQPGDHLAFGNSTRKKD